MKLIKLKFKIKNWQKKISFQEKEHTYHYGNIQFRSVSSLIKEYSHPFDPDGEILRRKAIERDISTVELQLEWDKKCSDACLKGTQVHSAHEVMLWNLVSPKPVIQSLFNEGYVLVDTEILLYDVDLKLAGQCDALLMHYETKQVLMIDFKTNKKIPVNNPFKKFMKKPFSRLSDDKYGHYVFQMNLYREMSLGLGVRVHEMRLVHLFDDETFEMIKVPYCMIPKQLLI